MLLRRNLVCTIELGVEIEEVDNHAFDGVLQRIMTEMMTRLCQPPLHGIKVLTANLLLFRCQFQLSNLYLIVIQIFRLSGFTRLVKLG